MAKSSGPMVETMGFLEKGFPALSRSAREFVRHHPREARLAVTVALEAAAAQCEVEDGKPGADVPDTLRPFIVRRAGGEDILGVSEAAARLEVSRTTVYDWVEKRTLLAWRSTKRGLIIRTCRTFWTGTESVLSCRCGFEQRRGALATAERIEDRFERDRRLAEIAAMRSSADNFQEALAPKPAQSRAMAEAAAQWPLSAGYKAMRITFRAQYI